MKWSILFHIGVVIIIILFAISPMIPVSIAASIAEKNNCVLHEGFVNPCIVNGEDMGQTLYNWGMMGWFAIATIPIGLGALVLYLLVVGAYYLFKWIRRRKHLQTQQPNPM